MSKTSDEEARQAHRKLIEAELTAYQEAIDGRNRGQLDISWVPSRADCPKCSIELLSGEELEQFSGAQLEPGHAYLLIRSNHLFDLRHRKSICLPNWVTEQTDLWSHESEGDPWQITVMGTATDFTGARYDVYNRVCDSTNYTFIRDCPACDAVDPLGIAAHLSEEGALCCEGPHDFVNRIHEEQQTEKERLDPLQALDGSEPTQEVTAMRAAKARLDAYLSYDSLRTGSRGALDPRCKTCGVVSVDVDEPCRFNVTDSDASRVDYLASYLWSSHCFVSGLHKTPFPAWITPETPFFQFVETPDDRSQSERPHLSIHRLIRNGFIRPCSSCATPDPFQYIERFFSRSFIRVNAPHDLAALAKEHEAYLGSIIQSSGISGPSRSCPKCDRDQPEIHQFCVQCGHKLS